MYFFARLGFHVIRVDKDLRAYSLSGESASVQRVRYTLSQTLNFVICGSIAGNWATYAAD